MPDYLNIHMSDVEEAMTLLDHAEVERVVSLLQMTRELGGTVHLFGNGGSGALAGHFANDLIKMARVKAACLVCEKEIVTAYGNDLGWENMFMLPLMEKFDATKDCALGISCSGNSENVVKALQWAATQTQLTIGLTGLGDTSLINTIGVTALIHARVSDIRVQEDLHNIVCHAMIRMLQDSS